MEPLRPDLDPSAVSKLTQSLVETGLQAFDPTSSHTPEERQTAGNIFDQLVNRTRTWILVQALNGLVKPGTVPEWLRTELLKLLLAMPLRRDGVRATLEFIFSVHPSNANLTKSEEDTIQKKGASITPEAIAMSTRLLSTVPTSISPQEWIDGIAPQLLQLLDGKDGDELAKVAAQIISFGILGRRQLGSPGSPGWKAFAEPILRTIHPSTKPQWRKELEETMEKANVVDLSRDMVVVEPDQLHLALRRLSRLLHSSPSPSLCRRLVSPILLDIWTLSTWPGSQLVTTEKYTRLASPLLQMYVKISSPNATAGIIMKNLLYVGDHSQSQNRLLWRFREISTGDIEITIPRLPEEPPKAAQDWDAAAFKTKAFVRLLVETCNAEDVSLVFGSLFNSWLSSKIVGEQRVVAVKTDEGPEDPTRELLDTMVLQQLMEEATDKLVSKVDQLVELVCKVLEANKRQRQEDEVISITLSLLSQMLSDPNFQKKTIRPHVLEIIEDSLEKISMEDSEEISQTARNLLLLFQYRDELEDAPDMTVPTERQVEDRKKFKLAMSYITDRESPPPVKSEGLDLISGLIVANSPALDIPAVLVLLSSLLADGEDFINLRVIKMYVQLANKHPKTICRDIVDHYLDPKERSSTDTRLRFGEALVQVIERLGATFTGEIAATVSETLLSIAGRRGHRPKTLAKKEREERARQRKNKEADDAWGGDVPDLGDDDGVTEAEVRDNEVLAQILRGWEGQRGGEDVRMRASALSVLASALETNVAGVGATLASSAVDLCVGVLALEPEAEKAILRRAAAVAVLAFVGALDEARRRATRLGFGLTDESRTDIVRTLRYVEATDNDGLVREHARDVAESLENWQLVSLLPQPEAAAEPSSGLERLVSLYGSGGGGGSDGRPLGSGVAPGRRPKIEEVD